MLQKLIEGAMPLQRLLEDLKAQLAHLFKGPGIAKGEEHVWWWREAEPKRPRPRFVLQGFGEREFIR